MNVLKCFYLTHKSNSRKSIDISGKDIGTMLQSLGMKDFDDLLSFGLS